MKYIRQENAGSPAARNTAIRNSSAEFLDCWMLTTFGSPRRLEESLAAFAGIGRARFFCTGLIQRIGPDGELFDMFAGNPKHAKG